MKKIFAVCTIILILLVVLTGCEISKTNSDFDFRGAKWGMSESDIIKLFGDGNHIDLMGNECCLSYEYQPVLDINCDISYYFYYDNLFQIHISGPGYTPIASFDKIYKTYKEKYGDHKNIQYCWGTQKVSDSFDERPREYDKYTDDGVFISSYRDIYGNYRTIGEDAGRGILEINVLFETEQDKNGVSTQIILKLGKSNMSIDGIDLGFCGVTIDYIPTVDGELFIDESRIDFTDGI